MDKRKYPESLKSNVRATYLAGAKISQICREFSLPRQTIYTWLFPDYKEKTNTIKRVWSKEKYETDEGFRKKTLARTSKIFMNKYHTSKSFRDIVLERNRKWKKDHPRKK